MKLSVNSELLEKARELGVDLATTLEEALAVEVQRRQRKAWLEENREAIEAYNEHVAQHGVFNTGLRGFHAGSSDPKKQAEGPGPPMPGSLDSGQAGG